MKTESDRPSGGLTRANRLSSVTGTNFPAILTAFSLLFLLSWPIVFSFDLWVMKDRGSFLNVDRLLAEHLRLGVDTFYSYGLLPVFIQHILFLCFGRGYWPMIGCTVVTMILMAAFWALLLRRLPQGKIWLFAIVAMSPLLFWVNPNFPYSLVMLSILFSLYFVLENRLDGAAAMAAIGCFSVPSLPLVLTGCLLLAIVLEWWLRGDRSVVRLAYSLAPGLLTYGCIAAFLIAVFGWQSVEATATPLQGMRFYKSAHFSSLAPSIEFLHPPGHSHLYYLGYYVLTPVTWWFASSIALFIFGFVAVYKMVESRGLEARTLFVVLCAALQAVFVFFARGSFDQYVIYEPILVAGILVSISSLFSGRWQRRLLIGFLCLGVAGETAQARATLLAWKNTKISADTAHLYAAPAWTSEWSRILSVSRSRRVLLLSYGTGAHQYFPTVESPDDWFLRVGEVFPADEARIVSQIKNADVVAEDRTGVTSFMDKSPGIQAELRNMCLTAVTANFKIWWRNPVPAGSVCMDQSTPEAKSRLQVSQ